MDIVIKGVSSDSRKILVWFCYQLKTFTVYLGDKICLFESDHNDSDDPNSRVLVASVAVGNPHGHWAEGSSKTGQVTLDISDVKLRQDNSYYLSYVRTDHSTQKVILTTIPLSVRASDGVLVKQQDLPSSSDNLMDFTFVPANISLDTSSYDCPSSSEQASSSFVVVSERDSQPEPEEFFGFNNNIPEELEVSSQHDSHTPEAGEEVLSSPRSSKRASNEHSPATSVATSQSSKKPKKIENLMENDASGSEASVIPPEMSLSVNMGGEKFISQREALMHKNANRDLLQKVKKLTKIMEKMKAGTNTEKEAQNYEIKLEELQRQRDELSLKNAVLTEQLQLVVTEKQLVERENKSLKKRNSQVVAGEQLQAMTVENQSLKKDNAALKKKISQLTNERDTQFARSSTLLGELQDKEQENEVLRSENLVLQGRLKRLEDNKKHDLRRQHKDVENEPKRIKPAVVEPVKSAHPAPSQPLESVSVRGNELQASSSRPIDLPLAGGAKLKAMPPPAASNQHSRAHDDHHKKDRPAPLDKQPGRKSSETSPRRYNQRASRQGDHSGATKHSQGSSQRERNTSERQLEETAHSVRGATVECPICQKVLHARENDYSVQLHVEHCLSNLTTY